jgi:hypothetical protein
MVNKAETLEDRTAEADHAEISRAEVLDWCLARQFELGKSVAKT